MTLPPEGLSASDWRAETRGYVRCGWNGRSPGDRTGDDLSTSPVGVLCGIALLAVKCLDERFGREKVLACFAKSVINTGLYAVVAPDVLGVSWPEVEADGICYIGRDA